MQISDFKQRLYEGSESDSLQKEKLIAIAKLYATVFADEPWNEVKVCTMKHYVGRDRAQETVCRKCQHPLEEAHPSEKVIHQLLQEIKKKHGTLSIFESREGAIVAAAWGSSTTLDFVSEIFKTDVMIDKVKQVVSPLLKDGTVFYLSEMMVKTEARRKGLANRMTAVLLEKARLNNQNTILLTHVNSPMAHIAENLNMTLLINRGEDSENSNRILFCSSISREEKFSIPKQ